MKAIRIEATGGPEQMQLVDLAEPVPGPGEIQIRIKAIGVNFIDIYHRSGLYPLPLPSGLGLEAAGVVAALGDGVDLFTVGDRVGMFVGPVGAYAEQVCIPANQAVLLPDSIPFETAAAVLLKGATVEFLLERCFAIQPGMTALIHAAAGGVGSLAVPWAKARGARVIGTAGSLDKAALAEASGADHVILYREQNVAAEVQRLTDGAGVDVVYDGVGRATFESSLQSLKPRGMLVSFGNASGPVRNVDLGMLARHGSLYVTRPMLMHYYATREELEAGTARLFQQLEKGVIKPRTGLCLPLSKAADAHRALEGRDTSGSIILIP